MINRYDSLCCNMLAIMPMESQTRYLYFRNVLLFLNAKSSFLLFGFKYPKMWFDLYCIYAKT